VRIRHLVAIVALPCGLAAQSGQSLLRELPETAIRQLSISLDAANGHPRHVWRDTPPIGKDGTGQRLR